MTAPNRPRLLPCVDCGLMPHLTERHDPMRYFLWCCDFVMVGPITQPAAEAAWNEMMVRRDAERRIMRVEADARRGRE